MLPSTPQFFFVCGEVITRMSAGSRKYNPETLPRRSSAGRFASNRREVPNRAAFWQAQLQDSPRPIRVRETYQSHMGRKGTRMLAGEPYGEIFPSANVKERRGIRARRLWAFSKKAMLGGTATSRRARRADRSLHFGRLCSLEDSNSSSPEDEFGDSRVGRNMGAINARGNA